MTDAVNSEQVKKFFFTTRVSDLDDQNEENEIESIEIYIPEVSNELIL